MTQMYFIIKTGGKYERKNQKNEQMICAPNCHHYVL